MAVLHSAPGLETLWQLPCPSGRPRLNAPELYRCEPERGLRITMERRADQGLSARAGMAPSTSRMAEMGSQDLPCARPLAQRAVTSMVTRRFCARPASVEVVGDRPAVAESLGMHTRSAGDRRASSAHPPPPRRRAVGQFAGWRPRCPGCRCGRPRSRAPTEYARMIVAMF